MTTLLRERQPVARKQHRCHMCHTAIHPGERYERTTWLGDSGLYDWVECQACVADLIGNRVLVWSWRDDGIGPEDAITWADECSRQDGLDTEAARRYLARADKEPSENMTKKEKIVTKEKATVPPVVNCAHASIDGGVISAAPSPIGAPSSALHVTVLSEDVVASVNAIEEDPLVTNLEDEIRVALTCYAERLAVRLVALDRTPGGHVEYRCEADVLSAEVEAGLAGGETGTNARASVLSEAESLVNGDRNVQYGDPNADFKRTAAMWSAYKGVEFTATDVGLMMALLKISRAAWSPGKRDHYVDGAGYFACAYDCAVSETKGERT